MASKIKAVRANLTNQDNIEVARAEAPELEKVDWRRDRGLKKLYFYAGIICIASATTGYDGSMLNNLRILQTWTDYFNDPKGSELGLLTALYSIGSIASLPIAPFIADRFGRKTAIITGCVIMIIGAAIQGSSKNLDMFEGGRFMMGFGNTLAQLSAPLLLTEICHPQHRARVTAIYNCLWNAGAIVNTWLTFGTKRIDNDWSWRIPTIVQGAPSIIQLCFIFMIPESPRWLISRDRADEALHMLAKYHANGNQEDPTVQFEYVEIKETLRLEFIAKKTSSYLDFFKTKGNRYRFALIVALGLFSQLSGNSLTSYYATDIYNSVGLTNKDAQLGLNGGLTILSLIVSVTFAMYCDKFGRRPLFLAATTGMLLAFTMLTICTSLYQNDGNETAGRGVIGMIWVFSVTYAFAWSGLLVAYTVEILPFKLRAKGLMLLNFWIQVALTFSNYVNPYGFEGLKPTWRFYCIYNAWIAVELVLVYFFFVETKGPTLEEIAKIFDGENAEVGEVDPVKVGLAGSMRGNSLTTATEKDGFRVEHRDV